MGHVGDTHPATLSSSPPLPQVTSGKATGAVTNTVLPQPLLAAGCPHCNCVSASPSGVKDPPGAMRAPALPACRVVAVERKSRSSPPAASSFFSFPFSSAAGPVPSLPSPPRALPPHRTPHTPLSQPALGARGTQGSPAAAKPPPIENVGAEAPSQRHCPVFPPRSPPRLHVRLCPGQKGKAAPRPGHRHPLSPAEHPPSRKPAPGALQRKVSPQAVGPSSLLLLPGSLGR